MTVADYKQLIVWQKSMDLAANVYRCTQQFPREEVFGLASQVRRAAVSIVSNIAEGQGRGSTVDFIRFLRVSNGSRQEAETQLILAQRLGYTNESSLASLMEQCAEIGRMLAGLIRALETQEH